MVELTLRDTFRVRAMERPDTVAAGADTLFMVSAAGNLAHGSITWNDLTCALPLQVGSMSGLRQNVKYMPRGPVSMATRPGTTTYAMVH